MYKTFIKRFLDIAFSSIALVCLSPFILVVTVLLHFANEGAGAFFFQERPGKDGKIFRMIKFKTMNDKRDERGNLLLDTQRITKVGRFVRSSSLDELPQLINVFFGDMAVVGPRPAAIDQIPITRGGDNAIVASLKVQEFQKYLCIIL